MKVLLDHSVPRPTVRLLSHHACRTACDEGCDLLTNGELLSAAEAAGFECLLTADTNIRYQQNLATRRIALAVLSTNTWAVIRDNAGPVRGCRRSGDAGIIHRGSAASASTCAQTAAGAL